MALNLIDLAKSYLTPDLVSQLGGTTGESTATTQTALGGMIPTVLAGLIPQASTASGAQGLFDTVLSSQLGPVENLGSAFSSPAGSEALFRSGRGLLDGVFGERLGGVVDFFTRSYGLRTGSGLSMLSFAAPFVMGVLGKHVSSRGLDAAGLSRSLLEQKHTIQAALPAGIGSILGLGRGGLMGAGRGITTERGRLGRPAGSRWVGPVVLLALLGVGGGYLLRHAGHRPATTARYAPPESRPYARGGGPGEYVERDTHVSIRPEQPVPPAAPGSPIMAPPPPAIPPVSAPAARGGGQPAEPVQTVGRDLGVYLAHPSAGAVPQRFQIEGLKFDFGTARLSGRANDDVEHLASLLQSHPNTRIRLEGYTDSVGSAAANARLSLSRADAVKSVLVARGIDASRIETQGLGAASPIASNDSEEGRALNRRIDVVVLTR
jgi:OOP family OmpA-OmpF porin